jgi:hypothetical protein
VLEHYAKADHEGRSRISGLTILGLFEAVCLRPHLGLVQIIVPLAEILSSEDAISDYYEEAYRMKLSPILQVLCDVLTLSDEDRWYPVRVQALTLFTSDEALCKMMINVETMSTELVRRLASPDWTVFTRTWVFFRGLTSFASPARSLILKDQSTTKALVNIINTESTDVLRNFLEWSVRIWTTLTPDAQAAFCQAMLTGTGRISCIYRTRRVLFRDDPFMIMLVEKYYDTIKALDVEDPQIAEFQMALARNFVPRTVMIQSVASARRILVAEGAGEHTHAPG